MHRLIPRSELHIYHGGHLDLITHPKPMATIVEAFLDGQTEAPDSTAGTAAVRHGKRRKPWQVTRRERG
jgi:hypothetical protein